MFSEAPVRRSQQTRPLPELRRGVSDAVSSCYRRQLERNHEGLIIISKRLFFVIRLLVMHFPCRN